MSKRLELFDFALNLFAEIGVILLLFVIGIEFPYSKIKSIGRVAIGVGTIGLMSTLGVVFYSASALGLNFMDSLFIAAALSISSTAIIVKILEDMGHGGADFSENVFIDKVETFIKKNL